MISLAQPGGRRPPGLRQVPAGAEAAAGHTDERVAQGLDSEYRIYFAYPGRVCSAVVELAWEK